jgi:hypothetical protein
MTDGPDHNPKTSSQHAASARAPIGKIILGLWLFSLVVIFTLLGVLWSGGGAALRTAPATGDSDARETPTPGATGSDSSEMRSRRDARDAAVEGDAASADGG